MKLCSIVALTFSLFISCLSLAENRYFSEEILVVTGRSPEFEGDTRHQYGNLLLKLTLDKTLNDHGPYNLEFAPPMTHARTIDSIERNRYKNMFYGHAYKKETTLNSNLGFIPFPIVSGLLGYRACFYPLSKESLIKQKIETGLTSELVHGQGKGWIDVKILKHNGYLVKEVGQHESLFKMVAANRFDLFCRGAHEVLNEYKRYKPLDGLGFEKTIMFKYDVPVFFYANTSNKKAIARVYEGLKRAYRDGSLYALFIQQFGESLEFVKIHDRKIIPLANPLTKELDDGYKKYEFDLKQVLE